MRGFIECVSIHKPTFLTECPVSRTVSAGNIDRQAFFSNKNLPVMTLNGKRLKGVGDGGLCCFGFKLAQLC